MKKQIGWIFGIFFLGLLVCGAASISGALPVDTNQTKVQDASQINFQDGAVTPIVSPVLAVPTTAQAFAVPGGAVTFIFSGVSALRYGDNATMDGTAGHGYKKGLAGTDQRYACAGVTTIYVRAESGTSDVDFCWEVVGK